MALTVAQVKIGESCWVIHWEKVIAISHVIAFFEVILEEEYVQRFDVYIELSVEKNDFS